LHGSHVISLVMIKNYYYQMRLLGLLCQTSHSRWLHGS